MKYISAYTQTQSNTFIEHSYLHFFGVVSLDFLFCFCIQFYQIDWFGFFV